MRAEPTADRQVFHAVATGAVPVVAVLVPFVVLSLGLHLFAAAGGAAALALVVGGWLVARHGRGAAAGLFVGSVLGSAAALVGVATVLGWRA